MILSDRSMCMIPHQSIGLLLSSLFLIRLFSGAQGRGWKEAHMFRIYCKVKNRTQKRKQIIQSDQDVQVCGIFLDGTCTPFCMTLSLFFWNMGYLSFFFFFPMLLGMDIFLLLFSCIAHIIFATWRVMSKWWSIFVWMRGIFLRNFQCRSQHEYIWSVRDLDLKSMKRIS